MKGIATKVTALLLIVWYSMSIIGFDIHTCNGSGESFVVTFVEGLECEDIHPEHHCTKGSCCSHSHNGCEDTNQECIKTRSCCSSDYQVLALTGTVLDEKNGADDLNLSLGCHCICSDTFWQADLCPLLLKHCVTEGFSPGRMPDIQSLLGVWRI